MLDGSLMLWELSVTEQRYWSVLEACEGVPVTFGHVQGDLRQLG